jgi:ribosomal protein S27AE
MMEQPKCPHCGLGVETSATMGGSWGGGGDEIVRTYGEWCPACGWGVDVVDYEDGRRQTTERTPRSGPLPKGLDRRLMSDWRLIESAPRDGSNVLLGGAYESSDKHGEDVETWVAFVGRFAQPGEYDAGNWQGYYDAYTPCQPTHWMPLPDPPAA